VNTSRVEFTSRAKVARVRLTNDRYLITLRIGSGLEHYYRNGDGWVKLSTRGRKFSATAEQVLNHLLPALAGVKPGVTVEVSHRDLSKRADERLMELQADTADE
jgi:hypothetical protein